MYSLSLSDFRKPRKELSNRLFEFVEHNVGSLHIPTALSHSAREFPRSSLVVNLPAPKGLAATVKLFGAGSDAEVFFPHCTFAV